MVAMPLDHPNAAAAPVWHMPLAPAKAPPLETEWLLTNGIGGFAMGTVAGCNTRRYHGLMIASLRPPVDRVNTVSFIGEAVECDEQTIELFNCEFATDAGDTVFHPHGWRYLVDFAKDTSCRWTYDLGPVRLHKELRLVWQRNFAVVTYRVDLAAASALREEGGGPPNAIKLRFMPFVALRDFHHLRHGADPAWFDMHTRTRGFTIGDHEWPTVHIAASRGSAIASPNEWRNFRYRVETDRGQDDTEAMLCPGAIEWELADPHRLGEAERTITLAMGPEPIDWSQVERRGARAQHLRRIVRHVTRDVANRQTATHLAGLAAAGDDFVVRREMAGRPGSTILAGYPWFADWGRDTMISLPGLLLCTGRFDEARRTLTAYAEHLRDGLIPNRFDDYANEPHYNTVDASLWFIHAALEYVRMSGDESTWRNGLLSACGAILDAYRNGTPAEIGMDEDGLIAAGTEHTQLTWMDAKRDGVVFTPRHGKAVEINALWYRALRGLAETGGRREYADLADRVGRSFVRTFWNEQLGYLVDHVNEHGADLSLRPNQVLAVSLAHSPLPRTKQQRVMKQVRQRLLTPRGLRTLPVEDANYHGRCAGPMFQRDRAYHQGTVWAWLIGPYVEGWLRAHRFSRAACRHARSALEPLLGALGEHSLGQLHEVFDGDAPHAPRGCIAQAWSVAETLRAMMLIERGEGGV